MLNKILIILTILAAALVIVVLYNLNDLAQYKICMSEPVMELSNKCKEVLSAN